MKSRYATALFLSLFAFAGTARAEAEAIHVNPSKGAIAIYKRLTLSFPQAMVAADKIDLAKQASPVELEPHTNHTFIWKSQTECQLYLIGQLIPRQKYTLQLKDGVKDLAGDDVTTTAPLAEFETADLSVKINARNSGKSLSSKPAARLLFNYPISLDSAVDGIYLQDRDTRERFATELVISSINAKPGQEKPIPTSSTNFEVVATAPLPVGRTVDLIVDSVRSANGEVGLLVLKAHALGTTSYLEITSASGYHSALAEPSISIRTNQRVSIDSVGEQSIRVEPEVPGLKRLAGTYNIHLEGEFDLSQTYTVTVDAPLSSQAGYPLKAPSVHRIEFSGTHPAIYFPSTQFFQRAGLGLNVKFLHANTGEVTWRLAEIPPHQLSNVWARVNEYNESKIDPLTGDEMIDEKTGWVENVDTELLVDALKLKTRGSGTLPGAVSTEPVFRDIRWRPAPDQPIPSGAYLLEVHAPTEDGRITGNRAMIFFNDIYVTQKRTPQDIILKLSKMDDSTAVPGAHVKVVSDDNQLIAENTSDAQGMVRFSRLDLRPKYKGSPVPHHFIVDSPSGRALQYVDTPYYYDSGYAPYQTEVESIYPVTTIITDRNLYRPGHTVKFKGITRVRVGDAFEQLEVRSGLELNWKITSGRSRVIAAGSTKLDESGGWEGEWEVPKDTKLGHYSMHCAIPGLSSKHGYASFRVEEYRVPLFEVELAEETKIGDTARIRIQSNYFHGGPNANAQVSWTARWSPHYYSSRDRFMRGDRYSEKPHSGSAIPELTGKFKLGTNGGEFIDVKIPADLPYTASRYSLRLSVDVTSPEGRTISTGIYGNLQVVPHDSGLRMEVGYEPNPHLLIEVGGFDIDDKPVAGLPAELTLFLVESKTVKEKVSPGVFRYRNFQQYQPVLTQPTKTGEVVTYAVEKPGRYVSVSRLLEDPNAPTHSNRVTVAGEAPAAYPVHNSSAFMIKADKKTYQPGDTAKLAIEAPFGGKAWVSVETDDIIEQFVVDVASNASGIDLPIKPEYYPNAFVSIYLVKPGGGDHLPKERYGRYSLDVERPDLNLEVTPTLTKTEVEPGQSVSGEILVASLGEPVANADLTVMVVDEAVLRLGSWSLPAMESNYFPYRRHQVATYQALTNHHESFEESMVSEKGFLIGGGGGFGMAKNRTRSNFVARAFWKTRLRTDEHGRAKFDFPAPDNLTAFRVTAVANTKQNQFGSGQTTLRINKRLMIEPALPRFIRRGDELELRAVVRQSVGDNAPVKLTCSLDGALDWEQEEREIEQATDKDIPSVFRFRSKASRTERFAKIRFDAVLVSNPEVRDSVEISIPVYAPGILQRTARHGKIAANTPSFKLADQVPVLWKGNDGDVDLTLSHSPWLPKLLGLPEILDYPHGCFEQKGSRYLAYTELSGLLGYLPELKGRHANYAIQIEQGLREYEQSLLSNGYLPYWPGSDTANPYVTVLAAWVMNNAKANKFKVPEKLEAALDKTLENILRGREQKVDIATRCFAVYVQSLSDGNKAPLDVLGDLYQRRDGLREDSLALLALSMVNYKVMGVEQQQLAQELSRPIAAQAFDPRTFWSGHRSEAIRFLAMTKIGDANWRQGEGEKVRQRLLNMMDNSRSLNTQENLWTLIAFRAMHDAQLFPPLEVNAELKSENGVSVAWKTKALKLIGEFEVEIGSAQPVYYVADARVARSGEDMHREDLGFRIERVVKNLTEPKRIGAEEKPFKLGDEILITYRVLSKRHHYYAALTDELPAGLETVNFNLAQVAEFYELPEDADGNTLRLSHSELRDQQANLYFNHVDAGTRSYSILARATSAGQFTWPSTQISPMYETKFSGLSAPAKVFVQ